MRLTRRGRLTVTITVVALLTVAVVVRPAEAVAGR